MKVGKLDIEIVDRYKEQAGMNQRLIYLAKISDGKRTYHMGFYRSTGSSEPNAKRSNTWNLCIPTFKYEYSGTEPYHTWLYKIAIGDRDSNIDASVELSKALTSDAAAHEHKVKHIQVSYLRNEFISKGVGYLTSEVVNTEPTPNAPVRQLEATGAEVLKTLRRYGHSKTLLKYPNWIDENEGHIHLLFKPKLEPLDEQHLHPLPVIKTGRTENAFSSVFGNVEGQFGYHLPGKARLAINVTNDQAQLKVFEGSVKVTRNGKTTTHRSWWDKTTLLEHNDEVEINGRKFRYTY